MMDAATNARLALRGWAHATKKRRAIGAHAEAMWRDRARRIAARAFVAWAHHAKFAKKRRELMLDRASARMATTRLRLATRAWKARVRAQRTQRRDVIRAYLIMRAKKFLRAWLRVAMDGREGRPVKAVKATEDVGVGVGGSRAASESGSSVRRYRRTQHVTTSVDEMKSRLWTHATALSPPIVKAAIESYSADDDDVDDVSVDTTTTTTSTTATTTSRHNAAGGAPVPGASVPGELPTAPKQKAVVRRRKIVAKQAATETTKDEDADDVQKTTTTTTTTTSARRAPPPQPSQQPASVIEVIPTSSSSTSTPLVVSSSSSSSSTLSMVIVFVILGVALVGSLTILGMIFGFSLSTDGSSIAALTEAQRNVTILARASAAQRRELEACRTFGGGVPDASQNAAIASAEAKVSDSVVRISELEVKLSAAQAEKASAQSAQKLAEGRLHKLGSLAMDKLQIAEALDAMTTRAMHCETVSAQAIKLSKARDACMTRAERAENLVSTLKLQVSEYSDGLQSAQNSLRETVDVANACRSQIGLPAYSPKHASRLGALASSAWSAIPGLSDLFSFTAILSYLIFGYVYYLKVMVRELVVERDTLVTHLAKLNLEGAPPSAVDADAARASGKRTRSMDDLVASPEDRSERKKTTAERAIDVVIEEEEKEEVKENEEEDNNNNNNNNNNNSTKDVVAAVSLTSANVEAVTVDAPPEKKKEDDEQSERSIRLVEKWVEKSQDEEIKDELERIRRLVALEDEREKAAEKAQLDALKEKAQES